MYVENFFVLALFVVSKSKNIQRAKHDHINIYFQTYQKG